VHYDDSEIETEQLAFYRRRTISALCFIAARLRPVMFYDGMACRPSYFAIDLTMIPSVCNWRQVQAISALKVVIFTVHEIHPETVSIRVSSEQCLCVLLQFTRR